MARSSVSLHVEYYTIGVANMLTGIRRLRYVSQMNRNLDAAPFAVARCSSWSRFRGIRRGHHRHFRIERVTEAILSLLHLEDLAAIAIGIAPPAGGHQLVAGRHHLVQYLSYVDTCPVLKIIVSEKNAKNAENNPDLNNLIKKFVYYMR